MVRGVFRLLGLLLLVGGFIFFVYDGARSIADQALRMTLAGEFWNEINQNSQASAQAWLESVAPGSWKFLAAVVLSQPVCAVLAAAGLILLVLFRAPRPLIGYSRS